MGRARRYRLVVKKDKWDKRNHKFLAEEAIMYITSKPKWYEGICSQQTASAMVKRFKEGKLSDKKLLELLDIFGFYEHQPRMFRIDKRQQRINLSKIREQTDENRQENQG